MKKTLLLIATVLCCAMTMFAQNNNKISYQAVVRDTENKLVANKSVEVTVNIYNGTATTAAYTETQTVTTNLNGLISLMIGPDVETPAWNSIQWNQARIVTTVTLDNTPLGTLAMPMTAVPYAFYADKINPNSPMITDIYDKMQDDSTALHGALKDTARDIRGAITITNETLAALQDRVNTFNTTFCDSLKTCDVIKDMRDSIQDNAAAIAANATAMNSADAALDARIEADSNRLVALKNRVNTFNTTFCDSLKTCDVIKDMRDSIKNNAAAIVANATAMNSADAALDARIEADSNRLVALKNRVNTFNTTFCDSLKTCDVIKDMRDSIQDNAAAIAANATAIATKANEEDVNGAITQLNNLITALTARVNHLHDSIEDIMNNMPVMGQDSFTVAVNEQTNFTLNYVPEADHVLRMYINGVMVGGSHSGVLTTTSNQNSKVVVYDANKNKNHEGVAYNLKAGDKVTIVYWYVKPTSATN